MALCGIAAFHPVADGCDSRPFRWSSVLGEPSPPRFLVGSPPLRGWRARCSLGKIASGPESRGAAGRTGGSSSAVEGAPFPEEEEVGPVIKFKMSDFAVSDQVSVGLQGRLDEVIFEATVRDPESTLYNSRVVLRQLTSMQARRRGRRALEVLKKLAPRRIMYHSYAMQVHGYVSPSGSGDDDSFTLVHGYHGSYSLRHWLQLSDWLPTLEATLALDEEYVRRVGDDTVGGPAVTRQLRLTRILMRDLLIGVNYLHSHGLAHTELRLENVHISPVDKHVKGNNPSCLREFLLPILCRDSPSGNAGLQMLDRNWGAGWNLLSLLLATKPSARISCLDALRHPFLCGPRWRVRPSMHVIRWGLGSTAVRMAEDYIYGQHQRSRISYFIELMELLNPHPRRKSWLEFLPGRWRLVYSTGRHIGLTLRQPSSRVLIGNAYLTFTRSTGSDFPAFSIVSDISFKVMPKSQWPHDKAGAPGSLDIKSSVRIAPGRRFYLKEETEAKWKRVGHIKEPPSSLPAVKLLVEGIDISMRIGSSSSIDSAKSVLHEVRTQIPPEMFDVSELVCGTYVDSRMMVLRGVNGSALLFTRSCLTTT